MTLLEAIDVRVSRRSYNNTPIEEEKINRLEELIRQYNTESGLSITFLRDCGEAFNGLKKSYGMFSGVRYCIVMASAPDVENFRQKIGYYGELLVLYATCEGLGTCWVGASYDKDKIQPLFEDLELPAVITIGYCDEPSQKERGIYLLAHRKSKAWHRMYVSDRRPPQWFLDALQAVAKAPSAMNRQPCIFEFNSGTVTASAGDFQYNKIDLGIAKAHFDIAAGGKFSLAEGGEFTPSN